MTGGIKFVQVFFLGLILAGPHGALAAEFAAHRALYDLSLEKARSGSGISSVSGKMAVEWNNSCTGWAFQYRSVIDVTFDEGKPVRLTSNATTWESSDGRDYRFDVRHLTNGKETERIEGVAKVDSATGGGHTLFTHPKPLKVDLPAGTLFPVAHTVAITRAAKSGKPLPQFVTRTIFDGMDKDALYQVNAIIGPVRPPLREVPVKKDKMAGMPSWSVSLAYFSFKGGDSAPNHEIKMRLFDNGVADDLIMDFSEFVVRAQAGLVELLDQPSC